MITSLQINLHLTDLINNNNCDVVFQHDCLHVADSVKKENPIHQIISYCLTSCPSKWNIQENNLDQKLTFAELYKQNITSQQLYLWSAPMDVIERYQFYLNLRATSDQSSSSSMAIQLFYNCTLLRFGPQCQYSLYMYESHHLSLNEIIDDFYKKEYEPTTLTCYTHLKCNRGSTSACLDWSEICDGHIDCLNDGIDEENCWQLEINECEDNEYRCDNGQCISNRFFHDDRNAFECLDLSDEIPSWSLATPFVGQPTFTNEDVICPWRYFDIQIKLTNSCVRKRNTLLGEIMLLDTPNSLSEHAGLHLNANFKFQMHSIQNVIISIRI
jgi:hypothetical protein